MRSITMRSINRGARLSLLAAFAIAASGCASSPLAGGNSYLPAWGPFAEKNTSGIQTPAERIAELRELAEAAPNLSPQEQEQRSLELTQAIQTEGDPLVRAQIVRVAAALPTTTAGSVLRWALQDPERDVRIACCEAWGRRGGPESVEALGGVVSGDTDADVRLAAVRALGRVNPDEPGAVAALGLALEDPNPAMQYRAVESLRTVTGRDYGNDVNLWREYVAGRNPQPQPVSFAERLLGWWL